MRKILLVTAIISIVCGSVAGFDGKRKGFVLGAGIGFSPYIHWSCYDCDTRDDDDDGVALQFFIGYAWDEHNLIVYEEQTAIYVEGGESITQGGGFVSWHHYFRPAGRTFFTTTGLGFYTWRSGSNNYNRAGGGMLTGGGYEFSRHWQVGLFISAGWSTLGYRQMIHTTVHLIVGGVAF